MGNVGFAGNWRDVRHIEKRMLDQKQAYISVRMVSLVRIQLFGNSERLTSMGSRILWLFPYVYERLCAATGSEKE